MPVLTDQANASDRSPQAVPMDDAPWDLAEAGRCQHRVLLETFERCWLSIGGYE